MKQESIKNFKGGYVEIRPITFHNDDLITDHLDNKVNIVVALQPKTSLHSVVYPI